MNQREPLTSAASRVARRDFLSATAGGAAAAFIAPRVTIAGPGAKGANERIGVGFIGTGGRAQAHLKIVNDLKQKGLVEPVAVCDVYRPRLEAASQTTGGAKMYMEHEALLADPHVDVVCIATPDRLHAPQTIDALKAGKDVYCEKPLTHWSQFELAKKVEEAADKNERLVQVGTQHMADDNYPEIIQLIRDGVIGKPVHVQCSYFRRGDWGERMPIPDPNAKPGPDLHLGAVPGRRAEGGFQRVAVLPVADVLGLRGRAGHRPAGAHLHARSSASWNWTIPSGSSAAAAPSSTTARCPTSATSSPTIRADRAW